MSRNTLAPVEFGAPLGSRTSDATAGATNPGRRAPAKPSRPRPERAPSKTKPAPQARRHLVLSVPVVTADAARKRRDANGITLAELVITAVEAHRSRPPAKGSGTSLFARTPSVRRGVGPLTTLHVKMTTGNIAVLDDLAGEANQTRSAFVTDALDTYLATAQ